MVRSNQLVTSCSDRLPYLALISYLSSGQKWWTSERNSASRWLILWVSRRRHILYGRLRVLEWSEGELQTGSRSNQIPETKHNWCFLEIVTKDMLLARTKMTMSWSVVSKLEVLLEILSMLSNSCLHHDTLIPWEKFNAVVFCTLHKLTIIIAISHVFSQSASGVSHRSAIKARHHYNHHDQ